MKAGYIISLDLFYITSRLIIGTLVVNFYWFLYPGNKRTSAKYVTSVLSSNVSKSTNKNI
jgi:hypothetical protein